MKRKRQEHEERRRPLAEINLGSTVRPRVRLARRGCFAILVLPIIAGTALVAAWSALN